MADVKSEFKTLDNKVLLSNLKTKLLDPLKVILKRETEDLYIMNMGMRMRIHLDSDPSLVSPIREFE